MTYAKRLVQTFGGVRAMARKLEVPASTVQNWKTRGLIPAARQGRVLRVGQRLGLPVAPADFFEPAGPAADRVTGGGGTKPKGP